MSGRLQVFDIEQPLAAFFKASTDVARLVGGAGGIRVYADAPPRSEWAKLTPFVNLFRIPGGGEPAGRDLPEDRPWVQIDVWGKTKPQARAVAQAISNRAAEVLGPTPLPAADGSPSAILHGLWRMQGFGFAADKDTDRPRYLATYVVSVIWAQPSPS